MIKRMKDKIINYSLSEHFIEKLADFVNERYIKKGADISRLSFIFEGKRPALFLRKELAKRTGKGFFSPRFFSIDEFIHYTLSKKMSFRKMSAMESGYMLYSLVKDNMPELLRGREKFSEFLPWAREISAFIDTLDIEDIASHSLKNIQASAAIGYDIPEVINGLLKGIVNIRKIYHNKLLEKKCFSRGFIYLLTAKAVSEVNFDEFDQIFFCGLFYMEKTERKIIKYLFEQGKALLFFQGDEGCFPVLKDISRELSGPIKPEKKIEEHYRLEMYSAFDKHSQVSMVREILKGVKNLDSTVIVLPEPESMVPLVSELGGAFGEFNVSIGYGMKRSSVYSLFELIVRAQKTKKEEGYYSRDYIAVLSQPLVKNLLLFSGYHNTRVLVHKVEEALLGRENTSISGSLFIKLGDIEQEYVLFKLAAETLSHMGIEVSIDDLEKLLKELHNLLFRRWEDLSNFKEFSFSLGFFLDELVKKSFMKNYPLNLKITERIYAIKDELEGAPFSKENFSSEDIFKIFGNMLENEMAAFLGSPLKGMQILGLLETRSLNFENVIIMDANESILPKLRVYDPLIPSEVKLSLGLDTVRNTERIQRYLFKRIISAAKKVYLIYEESEGKEKSRFVEELIWEREKKRKDSALTAAPRLSFRVNVLAEKKEIKKNKKIVEFLNNFTFSASSVNTYLNCPLAFYFQYILRLEEKEEIALEPEGKDIGIFIHHLLEETFGRFVNKEPVIDQKFHNDFFKIFSERFKSAFSKRMRSDSFLLEEVMRFRLNSFLDAEKNGEKRRVKEILYLEKQFKEKIEFAGRIFNFKYIIDRVDRLMDNSVLIIDYKTGGSNLIPQRSSLIKKMEFSRKSIRERIRSFQLPIYYHFEKRKYEGDVLKAALYNIKNLKLSYFPDKEENLEETMKLCLKGLDFILQEILDAEKTFAADYEDENNCRYCSFKCMCR